MHDINTNRFTVMAFSRANTRVSFVSFWCHLSGINVALMLVLSPNLHVVLRQERNSMKNDHHGEYSSHCALNGVLFPLPAVATNAAFLLGNKSRVC